MYFSMHMYTAILLTYGILLVLLVAAHLVWVWQVGREAWRSGKPLPARLGLIAAAAATPVIGFYAALAIRYFRLPAQARPGITHWTFIMPALALAAVLGATLHLYLGYAPSSRTWSLAWDRFQGMLAFYVVAHLILHMSVRIAGLSSKGVCATRMHLITSAGLLALVLFTD